MPRRPFGAARRIPIDLPILDEADLEPRVVAPAPGETRELALLIATTIGDTPARDTLVLDIYAISPVADFFVICSGENERQLRAILRDVTEHLAEQGVRPDRTEGTPSGGWILMDYGAVIVHIFDVALREFYRLEELWSEAQTVLAIQ